MKFVANGQQNAWVEMEPSIRAEVEQEFAEEWNASGIIRRWFLQRKIDVEVTRRLEECAPNRGLY